MALKSFQKKYAGLKWPGYLWAMLIAILCGIPGKDIPHISFLELLSFDKFVHASIFSILIYLLLLGQYSTVNNKSHNSNLIFFICILYGGMLELAQGYLFVDRSADIYDFIANSVGVFFGFYFSKKQFKF